MNVCSILAVTAAAILLQTGLAAADPLPAKIRQCTNTTIKDIGTRLEDSTTRQPIPGSGSAVDFANGGQQVSYETVAAITRSRAGDPVRMCLVSIPRGCPPGDDRGRIYKTTNLRTRGVWTLPDAEHQCGGA